MEIFVFSWNIHWGGELPSLPARADIIVVALQECLVPPSSKQLDLLYPGRYHYTMSMVTLHTIVVSRRPLGIRTELLGMGYFGFPNKGALLAYLDHSLCIANVHFVPSPEAQAERMGQLLRTISAMAEHDPATAVLVGDFNFRIVAGADQAVEFLRTYPVFREGAKDFKPTYKYSKGEVDPKRTPSYCDRIFIASKYACDIPKYDSLQHIMDSDHKPVVALLRLDQKSVPSRKPLFTTAMSLKRAKQWTRLCVSVWENRKCILGMLLLLFFLAVFTIGKVGN